MRNEVWVVLTEPAGPNSQLVEVEDVDGKGYGDFEWREWHDGLYAIGPFAHPSEAERLRGQVAHLESGIDSLSEISDAQQAEVERLRGELRRKERWGDSVRVVLADVAMEYHHLKGHDGRLSGCPNSPCRTVLRFLSRDEAAALEVKGAD